VYGRTVDVEGGGMEFLILGPLEVRNGDELVRVGAAKQRTLLGVLLLHANEPVSTARLVEELWGEEPPATAESLVQGYVHALRKQLGAGVVETMARGYRLEVEPASLDLLEFERLIQEARAADFDKAVELRRQALGLWRGSPLADVALEGPDRHTIERLAEVRLGTQVDRLDAELALGRHAQVIGELEALVAEHPYHERAAALLMLALYRSGRQVDALEAYRAVRRRLSNELGLQPGQELRELEAAILRQDEALAAPRLVAERPAADDEVTRDPSSADRTAGRRRLALVGALAVLAIAMLGGAALVFGGEPARIAPPNSIAVIDVATNGLEQSIPVGNTPGPVAAGAGFVWVGNPDQRSLIRIDPATYETESIPLGVTPDTVTVGAGAVWVVSGRLGTLYRVDPGSKIVAEPTALGQGSVRSGAGVDVGEGSVWAVFGDATLARVAPVSFDGDTFDGDGAAVTAPGPTAVVAEYGWVWVAAAAGDVQQFSPESYDVGPLDSKSVGRAPTGIAAGNGAIWVACRDDDAVWRIEADLNFGSPRQIPVGNGPTAVAFGAGAVWVANRYDGTVSRIDPETHEVVKTIEVGNAPSGIAVSDGRVWVSVQKPVTS
jgi:YVTN family beta-propeller protein